MAVTAEWEAGRIAKMMSCDNGIHDTSSHRDKKALLPKGVDTPGQRTILNRRKRISPRIGASRRQAGYPPSDKHYL